MEFGSGYGDGRGETRGRPRRVLLARRADVARRSAAPLWTSAVGPAVRSRACAERSERRAVGKIRLPVDGSETS